MGLLDVVVAVSLGLGLSAACGLRVFVPPLALGIASYNGMLPVPLSGTFQWMDDPLALGIFGVATMVEIAAYYIPWVDNFLDTVTTPAAIGAGAVVTAAVVPEASGPLQYVLPLIAGGAAGIVQGGTVTARAASSASTGGLGNPVVSTAETGTGVVTTGGLLALVQLSPYIFIAVVVLFLVLMGVAVWLLVRWRRGQAVEEEGLSTTGSPEEPNEDG